MLQTPKPKFKLRKLPLWGKVNALINFEWPTQEVMDSLPWDTALKSIKFATSTTSSYGSVAFIQCHLSNGVSSPLVSNLQQPAQFMAKVINFDTAERKVKMVSAIFGEGNPKVYNVIFYDKDSNIIDSYNPLHGVVNATAADGVGEGPKHEIRENEEIVGFYGQKDQKRTFDSLGFIVSTREF